VKKHLQLLVQTGNLVQHGVEKARGIAAGDGSGMTVFLFDSKITY
jgi:hypothetical protein